MNSSKILLNPKPVRQQLPGLKKQLIANFHTLSIAATYLRLTKKQLDWRLERGWTPDEIELIKELCPFFTDTEY